MSHDLVALDRASPKKICVIGDPMFDVWVHGTLGGCQDGCPKFARHSLSRTPGGAAGAARQLDNWAAGATLLALKDPRRNDHKSAEGGSYEYAMTGAHHPAAVLPSKARYVDDATGRAVFRSDDECEGYGLAPAELAAARDAALRWARHGGWDALLVADYDKGFLDDTFIHQLLDAADEKGVPAVLDPKRPPCSDYWGAALKCNLDYACRHFNDLADQGRLVITCGAQPPIVWDGGATNDLPEPVPSAPCVNHVGAGDCFAAVLTLALAHGLPLEEAAAWAHAAGKVYVRHPHGRPPWPHEVRRELDPAGGKVLTTPDLATLRASVPGRVVFTNGCFDLLSPGHMSLLRQARALGEALVVAVNDDVGVYRLKGVNRPAVPLEARLAQLAACQDVDWVIPFSERGPEKILAALKPDLWAKGEEPGLDWTGSEHAGQTRTLPRLPGWSTRETVKRLKGDLA